MRDHFPGRGNTCAYSRCSLGDCTHTHQGMRLPPGEQVCPGVCLCSVERVSALTGLCWVGVPGCLSVHVLTAGLLQQSVQGSVRHPAPVAQPLLPRVQAPRGPPLPRPGRPRGSRTLAAPTPTPCGCFRTVGFTLAKIWIVCFTISSSGTVLTLDLSGPGAPNFGLPPPPASRSLSNSN